MRIKRKRVDVNLEELDQIIDRGTQTPLSESEGEKLKEALHALVGMLPAPRSTEKTSAVLPPTDPPQKQTKEKPKGHGRNGASSYTGAKKVAVAHPTMHAGEPCPGCIKGKVYPQKEPRVLVRVAGQAPLAATVYELDRLRCNLCGEVFTAPEPEGVGPEKYDETTAAMIALLKYGSGMPFYRLEKLEHLLGIPLPTSTQWEIVEETAEVIQTARDELIRQAAQGEVLHNDDTSMRVQSMEREASDDRTGVYRVHPTRAQHRAVLYRPSARGRKPARCVGASRQRSGRAYSDVRRTVAQHLRAARRRRDPAGQLSGARKKTVRGSGGELSGILPLCSGDIGRRI